MSGGPKIEVAGTENETFGSVVPAPETSFECPPLSGLFHAPGFLSVADQVELIELARVICRQAPLRRPSLPNGQPLRLRLTNCGAFGWWSDAEGGYRYIERHPTTGQPFPEIPARLLALASDALVLVGLPQMRVDNLLINHYAPGDALGMHVDRSEQDRTAPIVSLSIGADAKFMLEHPDGLRMPIILRSGDLLIQPGRSRGWLHGIDRICPTMPNLCRDGGRINFTLRKVTLP